VIAVLAMVSIALSIALLALLRDTRRQRASLERLAWRVTALEREEAVPQVLEPEPDSGPLPPRRPSQLLN
jgi:type II secretory pathway pseudopilin PulG